MTFRVVELRRRGKDRSMTVESPTRLGALCKFLLRHYKSRGVRYSGLEDSETFLLSNGNMVTVELAEEKA